MAKLFKIIDKQTYFGQGCSNVYWYACPSNVPTALQVASAFNTQVIAPLRNVQSQLLNHDSLYVREMLYGVDVIEATQTGSTAGTQGGDGQQTFNSFGFGLAPASGAIKQGAKRYAGLVEGATANGELTAAFKILLNVVASAAIQTIVLPTLSTYLVPVIVRVTNSPASGWLVSQIISYLSTELGTQNSRKRSSGGGPLSLGSGLALIQYDEVEGKSIVSQGGNDTTLEQSASNEIHAGFVWSFMPVSQPELFIYG